MARASSGRPTIRPWMPPKDSIWRCPCGYEDTYPKVCGHRRGHRNRPACASGPIQPVSPDARPPHWDLPEATPSEIQPIATAEAPEITPGSDPAPSFDEHAESAESAEQIAALLNRQVGDAPSSASILESSQGYDAYKSALSLLESAGGMVQSGPDGGEWSVDAPSNVPGVFEVTLQVKVPPYLLAAYEWSRSNGWHVGSDSFGEWLIDMALDHWSHCMDLEIGVYRKSEVGDGDIPADNHDGGPSLAGPASHAEAQRN